MLKSSRRASAISKTPSRSFTHWQVASIWIWSSANWKRWQLKSRITTLWADGSAPRADYQRAYWH